MRHSTKLLSDRAFFRVPDPGTAGIETLDNSSSFYIRLHGRYYISTGGLMAHAMNGIIIQYTLQNRRL
jgi:hypothetical protein